MPRTLVTIAALGLGAAVILVGASAMLSGGHISIPGIAQDDVSLQKSVTRDFPWDGGDSIEIEAPATVHLVPGKVARVTISGPQDALDRVRLHDGTLSLSDSSFFRHDHLDVTFSGIVLREITLDGSGKILLGSIHQDRLSLEIEGSGEVEGEGEVDRVSLQVAGSGRARLGHLTARKAEIDIAGSGNVVINATDEADVAISGSGRSAFPIPRKSFPARFPVPAAS